MTDIAFVNAHVFDGVSDTLTGETCVRVSGGMIVEIGGKRPAGADVQIIDLEGATLMPGLIDAHFHAYAADANIGLADSWPISYLAHHAHQLLKAALHRGFTTVRDAGGADYGLWRAAEEGLIESPRIFYSGRAISQTGGHGDSRAAHIEPCGCRFIGSLAQVADGADQVRLLARETLRKGAHQIKIFVSGGIASPTDPIWMLQFSSEEIRAAVEEAASRRTYVMAHAYTGETIMRAVKLGVRSIEHGNLLTPDAAQAMAEHGAYLVPTLATYDALARWGAEMGFPPASIAKIGDVAEQGAGAVAMAREAGVNIGFGTDLLGKMHSHQLHEFRLRGAVDEPADVLRSATSVNASLLNREGELGVLREGAHADLIVVEGNPLEDLGLFWREPNGISLVMKAGRIVRNQHTK